jgi:hypothetical protein
MQERHRGANSELGLELLKELCDLLADEGRFREAKSSLRMVLLSYGNQYGDRGPSTIDALEHSALT